MFGCPQEDEFLVPHGYLSDNEAVDEEMEEQTEDDHSVPKNNKVSQNRGFRIVCNYNFLFVIISMFLLQGGIPFQPPGILILKNLLENENFYSICYFQNGQEFIDQTMKILNYQ